MSVFEEFLKKHCPNGVEFKKISDICKSITTGKLDANAMEENGKYRFYTCAKEYYKINTYAFDCEALLISGNGANVGYIHYYKGKFNAYQRTYVLTNFTENILYIKYFLDSKLKERIDKEKKTGNTPYIRLNTLTDMIIPIPPIEVQEEIVRILDEFTDKTTKLQELLHRETILRKKQYEYYRDKLLTFGDDVECKKLSEIAEIGTGSSNTNEELENGKYPFFVRSQEVRSKNEYEYDETAIITSGDGVGVGKIFHYIEGKYALHQRAYRIHIIDENVIPKYYFYYMKTTFLSYIEKTSFHSSVTSIRKPMLDNYPVPIPPLEEQERIVKILDQFDTLCNDITRGLPAEIELRKKQYEYYRDKLLTFKEKKV